jgi:Type IV secretion system pilin
MRLRPSPPRLRRRPWRGGMPRGSNLRPAAARLAANAGSALLLATGPLGPGHVLAAASIAQVIDNTTAWIVGILAGVATLFLTIGGLRYLMAGGDPGEVEKAKTALKSAAIGYGLAILAPVIVTVLKSLVGG